MVEITFGMALDGARWDGGPASIGKMTCGPLGMLKFLETRYALGGVEVSQFERIDAYVRKIEAADCEWCRKSFNVDRWSTASTLLAWRDELVALKWDKKTSGDSVRFSALAKIEAAGPGLPLGEPDRLARLLSEAKEKTSAKLRLVDAFDDLPLIWRELIKTCFKDWEEVSRQVVASLPEITVVKGVNEISIARDIVRYLSVGGNERVAVISEGETLVLDAELKRFGLPTFGVSDSSRQRKPMQELVAAFSEFCRTRTEEEYRTEDLVAVLDRVAKTLTADIEHNPISKLAARHVAKLKERLWGMQSVRRSALWRMVDMVVGEGSRCPHAVREMGGVRFLRSPGELIEPVDVALWWMFIPPPGHSGLLFRDEEKRLFQDPESGTNVIAEEIVRRNRRDTKAWDRCLANAKKRLILFIPDVVSGDAAGVHPFYDVLLGKMNKEPKDLEVRNSALVKDGSWSLAGHSVKLECKTVFRPKFSDECGVEPDAGLLPKVLSPTQLESLLSCPFQWYHKYHLKLKPSEVAKSETTKTRQGIMAHKMVEELVKASAASEAEVQANFPVLFDDFCEEEIPEFAEPDRKMEREEFKEKLLSSLLSLWRLFAEQGLKPIQTEYDFPEKDFCGVPFSGRADLILEGRDGKRNIFDFKWSTRKDYADKIKEGTSVQLAAYDWLSGFCSKSGYYLFPSEKFIENTQKDEDVWENVVATYKKRLEDMQSGLIRKAIDIGLDGYMSADKREARQREVQAQGLSLDIHAGCRYCDFKALCGKLWEEGGAE